MSGRGFSSSNIQYIFMYPQQRNLAEMRSTRPQRHDLPRFTLTKVVEAGIDFADPAKQQAPDWRSVLRQISTRSKIWVIYTYYNTRRSRALPIHLAPSTPTKLTERTDVIASTPPPLPSPPPSHDDPPTRRGCTPWRPPRGNGLGSDTQSTCHQPPPRTALGSSVFYTTFNLPVGSGDRIPVGRKSVGADGTHSSRLPGPTEPWTIPFPLPGRGHSHSDRDRFARVALVGPMQASMGCGVCDGHMYASSPPSV
ncbi:hypothetical protein C8Q79DRAFT_362331 [Trametes meyenii]|nr:hypothetical protein C8Q79DRAFT_362331 [Trametes meyenii]